MVTLQDIEDYLVRERIAPTTFGIIFMGDPALVKDWRAGRKITRNVAVRLQDFLRNHTWPEKNGTERRAVSPFSHTVNRQSEPHPDDVPQQRARRDPCTRCGVREDLHQQASPKCSFFHIPVC